MRAWGLFLAWLAVTTHSHAAIQSIALTGTPVASIPDEFLAIGENTFDLARLSNNGTVAYSATLSHSAAINSGNDYAVFRFEDNVSEIIARNGSGGVPSASGASFAGFNNIGIDNNGSVFARGTLVPGSGGVTTSNNQGFWKFTESTTTEIARTQAANAPGVTGVRFDSISVLLNHSSSGVHAYEAKLKVEGGATSANDHGIWLHVDGIGSLMIREAQTAPGVAAPFDIFSAPVVSNMGDVAFRGQLKQGGTVNTNNRAGIWNYNSGVGSLIARTGSGGVPGMPVSNFIVFEDPVLNSSGQLLLAATLNSDNSGLWRYDGTSGELLAIAGGAIPDIPDTTFFEVKGPLLSDNGQVVAWGQINAGPGVDSLNNTGLWAFDEVKGNRLLARTGMEGTVPGKPQSFFDEIQGWATNGNGDVLMLGELREDFDDLQHQGIWLYPYEGTPQLLLQSGDTVAGRTIERLQFLTHDDTRDSVTNIFNNAGQFVFQAEFTNGDFGLLLYTPDETTTYAEADFNLDGHVDATDLQWWSDAYGENAVGDADGDGDTDGRDLMIWQRQFTGPPVQTALAVPEPTVWWFVAFIFALAQHRSNFTAVRCV